MLLYIRELLTAARTYYVRTDGNDNNTGLTNNAAGAFLTIQKAISIVMDTLDLDGFSITIQVGDGTYTSTTAIDGPQTGRGTLTIQGNSGAPANVLVSVTGGNCFLLQNRASVLLKDMELRTTTSGTCIAVAKGSYCGFQNVRFGAAATAHISSFDSGSQAEATGAYTISGSTNNHALVTSGGQLTISGKTVTLSGTPNWSNAFVYLSECGSFRANGNTFSGSATGKRYYAEANGAIQTFSAGANYFPGDVAGSTSSGGQYA